LANLSQRSWRDRKTNTLKIYFNGKPEATLYDSREYGIVFDNSWLLIVQDDGSEFLSGAVAGIEIHNRALSASDGAALNLNIVNVPGPPSLLGAGGALGSSGVSRKRPRSGAHRPDGWLSPQGPSSLSGSSLIR
jgi:hypothetical protein